MGGWMPYSPIAMLNAILYAKLNKNMSDRELERHLLRHPHVAWSLGFDKVPSHQTFSYFKRERLTIEFLAEIFNTLRDHLVKIGTIDFSSVTMDSAPIEAFANLAKANREIKLDDSITLALLDDPIYQSLACQLIARLDYKKSAPAHVQKRVCCLNPIVLYELGGFLSQAKVAKYLNKKEHGELLKVVSAGKELPSEAMLSDFKKQFASAIESTEFAEFQAYLEHFFSQIPGPLESSIELFFPKFFAILQSSCSIVDPDVRLGYCAAKKQVFLGYRIQLLIDDKKNFL